MFTDRRVAWTTRVVPDAMLSSCPCHIFAVATPARAARSWPAARPVAGSRWGPTSQAWPLSASGRIPFSVCYLV